MIHTSTDAGQDRAPKRKRSWRFRPDQNQPRFSFRIQFQNFLMNRLGLKKTEKFLLFVVALVIGDNPRGEFFLSEDHLSDALECDRKTITRGMAGLERRGLMEWAAGPTKDRGCNTWLTCIGAIFSLIGVDLHSELEGQNVPSTEPMPQNVPSTGASKGQFGTSSPLLGNKEGGEESPLTPFDWETIELALTDFGMGAAELAVKAAQANGVTPGHIAELLEYARGNRHRWKCPIPALYRRVMRCRPSLPAAEGWQPFDQTAGGHATNSSPAMIRSNDPGWWKASMEKTGGDDGSH